jgi:putative endonuclease
VSRSAASRRAADRRGRFAEWLAAAWLLAKGYRLLALRARTPYGEVDLAALHNGLLVVVEVKARPDLRRGLDAISAQQKRRLAHAAVTLSQRWRLASRRIRFDIVIVRPWAWPLHIRDAWRDENDQ